MWTVAIIFVPCSKMWQAGTLRFMEHALFKSQGPMAQHEQFQLFPESFSLSSFIPPCFSLPLFFLSSFYFIFFFLLGWIRTRGVYLGWGSCSKTCVSTPMTGQVSQGVHREMQRGLINVHYEELEEKVVCVWIDVIKYWCGEYFPRSESSLFIF